MSTIDQLVVLAMAIGALGAMLACIYAPPKDPPPRPLPPELLKGQHGVDDPFRSPEAMDRRLEDFGRFNVRYNETDGVVWWQILFGWFFRR